jgi:predicted enzyme related to lactoylglutathione lyase
MNSVVHFEMSYEDRERMKTFYETAFGWKTQTLGPEMGNYVLATTTEVGADGRPTTPGMINGGFYERPTDPVGVAPSVVIAVDDVEAARKKITEAGGKLLGEAMEIPGVGMYASFLDTEGNRVSVIQPMGM